MADTADSLASAETQDAPGYDESAPPPSYSKREQEPPPYSATQETFPPPKVDTTYTHQPGAEDECSVSPEAPLDTTPPVASSSFEDKTVRRGFVRKVFSIVILQLLFTFSVVCVFTFSAAVKKAVKANVWVYLSSFFVFLAVMIALTCSKSLSRRHPWNIVGLVTITLSLSYMVGTAAAFHNTTVVIITMGVTLAISFAIIAFSAQTRYDFTYCYGFLLILTVDLFMFGIFCTFYYSYIGQVALGCLGALLFSLFLMIDCQLLMGTRSYSLDPEDYVNAALMIYLDVILIFLYLLGSK